jgi:hypothetical protein
MSDDLRYEERLSSRRTTALFAALTLLCLALWAWRRGAGDRGTVTGLLGCFGFMFLFYVLNYRTLTIRLDPGALRLQFGLFSWVAPWENVASAELDEIPASMYYGGAGIHFMTISGRYRASFNLLEYPRVVVAFKRKLGPVRDLSFSTRRPDEVLRVIRQAAESQGGERRVG